MVTKIPTLPLLRNPILRSRFTSRLVHYLAVAAAGGCAYQYLYFCNEIPDATYMKFQKTTEYALQIMAFLSRAKDRPVASSELHRHLSIPRKYLQRLLTRLSKQGLTHSTRGRKGGYSLARTPRQISLLQIVKTVEGFDDSLRCFFGFGTCPLNNPCALHDHWAAQRRSLLQVFSSTRLSDLAAETPVAQLPGLTLALLSPIL